MNDLVSHVLENDDFDAKSFIMRSRIRMPSQFRYERVRDGLWEVQQKDRIIGYVRSETDLYQGQLALPQPKSNARFTAWLDCDDRLEPRKKIGAAPTRERAARLLTQSDSVDTSGTTGVMEEFDADQAKEYALSLNLDLSGVTPEQLKTFKRQAAGYIKWVGENSDEAVQAAKLVQRAVTFNDAVAILSQHENPDVSFSYMVAQGYF